MKNIDLSNKDDFETFFEKISNCEIEDLKNDELIRIFSVFQHQADRLLAEISYRGLIEFFDGMPVVPFDAPDGVEEVRTILNGDS